MISDQLWLTILIRAAVGISVFGILLLFPQYLQQNREQFRNRRSVNLFLVGYLKWYFTRMIRDFFRKREITEFSLVITGIVMLAVILSLVPDDFIGGIGVEIVGGVITAWTFISYWSVRDILEPSQPDERSDIQLEATELTGN